MKKMLLSLVAFAILSFVTVSVNAQELFDEQSWGWGEEQNSNEDESLSIDPDVKIVHTFCMRSTGSSGGVYSPCSSSTQCFGVVYKEGGIKPSEVDKEILLNALQYNNWEYKSSRG